MITLYDGKPVPKVIDFGVAKATEQELTERTLSRGGDEEPKCRSRRAWSTGSRG